MKLIFKIVFLLFSLSFYGQNDKISVENNLKIGVVSADKMNVVYRGLPNPISIAVPNCKSFSALGNGLYKNKDGTYQLYPTSGLETIISLEIILNDGSIKKEVHKFRIKNIPLLYGKINGLTCNQSILLMTKKELIESVISIGFPNDFVYEMNLEIEQFSVMINKKTFVIEGNHFTKKVTNIINKLPINSIFEIIDFKTNITCDNCGIKPINPIKIMIVNDNYFHNNEE